MRKLLKTGRSIIRLLLIFLSIAMCVVVLWQVISRFILLNPSRWSEEVARYIMIWITFLAASIGVSNRKHLGLTIVVNSFKSDKIKIIFTIFQYACIIIFSLVLAIFGFQYALEGQNQTGMSIMIKMSLVYSVIPLSGLLMIINSVENIFEDVKLYKETRDK